MLLLSGLVVQAVLLVQAEVLQATPHRSTPTLQMEAAAAGPSRSTVSTEAAAAVVAVATPAASLVELALAGRAALVVQVRRMALAAAVEPVLSELTEVQAPEVTAEQEQRRLSLVRRLRTLVVERAAVASQTEVVERAAELPLLVNLERMVLAEAVAAAVLLALVRVVRVATVSLSCRIQQAR